MCSIASFGISIPCYPSECCQAQDDFCNHCAVNDDFEDNKERRAGAPLVEGQEDGPETEDGHDDVESHVEFGVDDPVGQVLKNLAPREAVVRAHGYRVTVLCVSHVGKENEREMESDIESVQVR